MEREDMANVLHALFTKGMEVHLKDETFEIIKLHESEQTECTHFSDWIDIFISEGNIHPQDEEIVREMLGIEHMKNLKEPDYINYRRYAGTVDGVRQYINVSAFLIPSVKSTEDYPIVLLGIIPVGNFIN